LQADTILAKVTIVKDGILLKISEAPEN
jgi:hypothetical protein